MDNKYPYSISISGDILKSASLFLATLIMSLLLANRGFSQQPTDVQNQINQLMPNPVSPSPNVAALGKFGDYPVSYFSGLPEISIPIYEIKSGGITVPITLSYHAGGIKPTDIASWVGMGWSLSAGGNISRNVQGMPDELYYYVTAPNFSPDACHNFHYMLDVTLNRKDTQADVFSYSMPGGSGKFMLGPNFGKPYLVPAAAKVINPTYIPGTYGGSFSKFEITDETGVLSRFGANALGATAVESTAATNGGVPTLSAPTAWHLMEMFAPNSNDQVSFYYQNVGTSSTYDVSYAYVIDNECFSTNLGLCPQPYQNLLTMSNVSTSTQLGLDSITFKTGKVEFVLGAQRSDATLNSLDRINIYSKVMGKYHLEKTIKFIYSYYTVTGVGSGPLQLTAVQFWDNTGALIEQYKLTYTTNAFSWNKSALNFWNARDLWGYFNGAYQNTDLVLPTTISFQPVTNDPPGSLTFGGAQNRAVNTTYTQEGVLQQITYPTGGYTQFVYEQNQYLNGTTPTLAGGLRLKQLISNSVTGVNSAPIIKTYKYGDNESGYGIANFNANQFNYSGSQSARVCDATPVNYQVQTYYSNSAFSFDPFDSTPILYPTVSEYIGDPSTGATLGKTIYVYDNDNPPLDIPYLVPTSTKYYSDSFSWQRGHLTSKKTYDASGNLLTESDITYTDLAATDKTVTGIGIVQFVAIGAIVGEGCAYDCVNEYGEDVVSAPFMSRQFFQSSGSMQEVQRNEYTYQNGSVANYVMKQTSTTYDPNFLQPTQVMVSRGNTNELGVTVNQYPFQFSPTSTSTGSALGVYMMNQKNMVSTPIESYTYLENSDGTNQRVVSGKVTTYRQNASNPNYVVADKIYLWESSAPIPMSGYSPVTISGNTFSMDPNQNQRVNLINYDNFGNLVEVSKTKDVVLSYQYGYNNSRPISEAKNAQNNIQYTVTPSTGTVPVSLSDGGGSASLYFTPTQTYSFHVDYTGTVVLNLGVASGTTTNPATANYIILPAGSNTSVASGSQLLAVGTCGQTAISFPNIAPGNYSLAFNLSTTSSGVTLLAACGQINYPQNSMVSNSSSVQEFIYESFEENNSASVVLNSAVAHCGNRYFNGAYTTSFVPPNSKNYTIEYWYLSGGLWLHLTTAYTNGMVLNSGTAIDDIRIYPVGTQMKSYTYDPALGETSSIDETSQAFMYDYDTFGRLLRVRNENNAVEKQYLYNYIGN